jgi:NADH oxidase (H2O2-forming)
VPGARIAVVGGAAAGISAGTTAKQLDPDAEVMVLTEFEDVAYSPCGIPYVYGGEIPDFERLFLSTNERYREEGIDLRTETVVTDLDVDKRTLLAKGQTIGFDRLILCTGFDYEQPDVPGVNLRGIEYVKNIRRAMAFETVLDRASKVAVVGATPLGIEMATAMGHREGVEAHLVEEASWLMVDVVDPDIVKPVHDTLVEMGVQMHLGTRIEGFDGDDGSVRAVRTSGGTIDADVVFMCTHKVPNNRLARAAGLKIGSTGGLVVDDHMRSSHPDVFAAGDCVELPLGYNRIAIQGLSGSHAYAQGRVAGASAVGVERAYDPVWVPWGMVGGKWQFGGVSFGEQLASAMGIPYVLGEADGISRARYYPGVMKVHVKLLGEPGTGRVFGAQMFGGEGIKERCDFLAFALKRGATFEDFAWMENIYSPPIGALMEPISNAGHAGLRALAQGEVHTAAQEPAAETVGAAR